MAALRPASTGTPFRSLRAECVPIRRELFTSRACLKTRELAGVSSTRCVSRRLRSPVFAFAPRRMRVTANGFRARRVEHAPSPAGRRNASALGRSSNRSGAERAGPPAPEQIGDALASAAARDHASQICAARDDARVSPWPGAGRAESACSKSARRDWAAMVRKEPR